MWKFFSCLVALGLTVYLSAGAAKADIDQFRGRWVNTDADTRGMTRLFVRVRNGKIRVRAFGRCQPQDCDWGWVRGRAYGQDVSSSALDTAKAVTAFFKQSFARRTLVMGIGRGRRLRVRVLTHYTDSSGRHDTADTYTFARARGGFRPGRRTGSGPGAAVVAVAEDCIAFNWKKLKVRKRNGSWKVVTGNIWLLDFGDDRSTAKYARNVLRYLKSNKQCFVGRPHPSMSYYLTNDRAPQGPVDGEDCTVFDPNKIRVRRSGGRWKVVEGRHTILDFGNKRNEADTAFAILRKYGVSHYCYIGKPNPRMTFFRR